MEVAATRLPRTVPAPGGHGAAPVRSERGAEWHSGLPRVLATALAFSLLTRVCSRAKSHAVADPPVGPSSKKPSTNKESPSARAQLGLRPWRRWADGRCSRAAPRSGPAEARSGGPRQGLCQASCPRSWGLARDLRQCSGPSHSLTGFDALACELGTPLPAPHLHSGTECNYFRACTKGEVPQKGAQPSSYSSPSLSFLGPHALKPQGTQRAHLEWNHPQGNKVCLCSDCSWDTRRFQCSPSCTCVLLPSLCGSPGRWGRRQVHGCSRSLLSPCALPAPRT